MKKELIKTVSGKLLEVKEVRVKVHGYFMQEFMGIYVLDEPSTVAILDEYDLVPKEVPTTEREE